MNKTLLYFFSVIFLFAGIFPVIIHAAIGVSQPGPANLNQGLVGWWTFDGKDVVNGVVKDVSGQGNNANLFSIATSTFYTQGMIGQAGNFDGVNDQASTTNTGFPDPATSDYSVSAWIRPTTVLSGAINPRIFTYATDTNNAIKLIIGNNLCPGKVVFESKKAGTNRGGCANTTAIATSTWSFIVGTFNSTSNTVAIYVNGITQTSTSLLYGGAPTQVNTGFIGASAGISYFPGKIDDVRLYNRVLTATEATRLYNTTKGSKTDVSQPGPANLNQGLVGWWTFDGKDVVNGVVKDVSGQGNNANLFSIATSTFYTQGMIGQAGNFDGVNDQASTTNTGFPDPATSDYSVSAWIRPTTVSGGTNPRIFTYATDTNNGIKLILANGSCPGKVVWEPKKAGVNYGGCANTTLLSPNIWYYLVGTFISSSNTQKLYVNGVSQTFSGFSGGLPTQVNTGFIGATSGFFPGKIDDLRLYNRALTAAEALKLYNTTKGSKTDISQPGPANLNQGLVGWWTFDGKDITNGRANDISGQGNHGNLVNIATSTFYAQGKVGQAFNFDGSNDQITTASDFIGTTAITASAWVYPRTLGQSSTGRIIDNGKFIVEMNTSNKISFSSDGSTLADAANSGIILNAWNFVTITRNTSGTANIYINGALSGTANQTSGTPVGGSTNVIIGNNNAASRTFDGVLDGVRIYNRVLTAGEITMLYSIGK